MPLAKALVWFFSLLSGSQGFTPFPREGEPAEGVSPWEEGGLT